MFLRRDLQSLRDGGLSGIEDMAGIPFTTAEDIRQNPLRFLCVSQDQINRVVTLPTSGTTGEPKRIFFTLEDRELTVDFFSHGMSTFTAPGDRVLILLPGERPGSVGELLKEATGRLGAAGIGHGPVKDPRSTLEVMERERVNMLVGFPVQALLLARRGPNGKTGSMPLIRYRTGDLGRFIPGKCPCGTSLKSMERVKQRIDGRVTGPGRCARYGRPGRTSLRAAGSSGFHSTPYP